MFDPENFKSQLFHTNSGNFEQKALALFHYQYNNNSTYGAFISALGKSVNQIQTIEEIPFLPIEFFKTHEIKSGSFIPEKTFLSSGTTGMQRSKHLIKDLQFLHSVAIHTFESFYGSLADFEILALLPSYLEQGDSSLISMVDAFMRKSSPDSSYYLNNHNDLANALKSPNKKLLIGVSYALLDFTDQYEIPLNNTLVMETGGMKGRRKELVRSELHDELKSRLNLDQIHSEYGMGELTSQAYGSDGFFQFPNWCKVLLRDLNDPLSKVGNKQTGGINIIDLANIHSCAFIETKDIGKLSENGTFEVLGRFDNSDIRGCNLLIH